MTLDISSKELKVDEAPKTRGAEMTSGSNRQKTARGYTVDSQMGVPFGATVSVTDQNYKVYHSVKMGTTVE